MIIGNNEIVFENGKRYYVENLTVRDYSLENTTPHLLKINDYEIKENSWVDMIKSLAIYLIQTYPTYKDKLLDFHTEWSKSDMFFEGDTQANLKKVDDNLYVNCNHNALHSCWFIQDLLKLFEIDYSKVYFLIRRGHSAEPADAKEYFKAEFKKEFSEFLQEKYNKSKEFCDKIISNIEKCMDPILGKSNSYKSFMLFDDSTLVYTYGNDLIRKINKSYTMSPKTKEIMKRYISYLNEFYKAKY